MGTGSPFHESNQGENDERKKLPSSVRINDIDGKGSDEGQKQAILALAKKYRMNTQIQRSIMVEIMNSNDYIDAFERLMRLGLKGKQEREIVYVILICVENEASYNPFYAALSHRLCTSIHHFKLTFQFAYWDRFKTICGGNENPSSRSTNI